MIDSNGNNLIFMLCPPRSGSSLVTVMLQNHSKVFATQEMWYLMGLYDLQLAPPRPYGGAGIVKQFYNGILPAETFQQACRSFSLQVYNGLLHSSGAEMVIDKSPRYYYILEFLDRLFPQSKRIWLIRNPLAVIASYKKVNKHVGERFNLKEDLLDPKFNIKMADITAGLFRYRDYFAGDSEYAYRLHYERLVAAPREELIRLCEFLGITYEEGLEKYGDFMDTAKSDLYFSMGVGDPFVGQHSQPHLDSLDNWKKLLDHEEIDLYCSTLGADLFRELGYEDILAEAEEMTGKRYDSEPNRELISLRSRQLAEASGCKWEERYMLNAELKPQSQQKDFIDPDIREMQSSVNAQVLQLQITLRSLEQRLEKSYVAQRQMKAQLDGLKSKINRFKSMIPFGNHLSNWASSYLVGGRKR